MFKKLYPLALSSMLFFPLILNKNEKTGDVYSEREII